MLARLAAIASIVTLLLAGTVSAQQLRDNLWVANGPVNAVLATDTLVYIGGAFSRLGPATGAADAIDAASGAPFYAPAMVVGTVNAVLPDGRGGYFVGGAFSIAQGNPRANLAHVDSTGRVTAWNPGTNGAVSALAMSAGVLFVGGSFTTVQ